MDNKDWYSVKEVAEILNVNEQTIRRYISSGQLEAKNIGGSVGFKISDDKLGDFLIKHPKYKKLLDKSKYEERITTSIKSPMGYAIGAALAGTSTAGFGLSAVLGNKIMSKSVVTRKDYIVNSNIKKDDKLNPNEIKDARLNLDEEKIDLLYQYVLDLKKTTLKVEISKMENQLIEVENELKYISFKSDEDKIGYIKTVMSESEIEELITKLTQRG